MDLCSIGDLPGRMSLNGPGYPRIVKRWRRLCQGSPIAMRPNLAETQPPATKLLAVAAPIVPAISPRSACDVGYVKTISTRQFCGSRTPGGVGTRGSFSPRPLTAMSPRATPKPASALATLLARRSDRRWL